MTRAHDYSADITILISTSMIPSHPSTAIISSAINSIREQLHSSPIIIMADGNNDPRYSAYLSTVESVWCREKGNYFLQHHITHRHQSGMLSLAMAAVDTPYLLYWEHDWLPLPDIPWSAFCDLLSRGDFNTIKLHANPRVSPYYEHMMESRVMYQRDASGALVASDRHTDQRALPVIPLIRTRQWSQNPHLSRTDFYRDKILPLVDGKCDFIENVIHGIVASAPWDDWKTAIYNPADGDMMRVRHLDGKGTRL